MNAARRLERLEAATRDRALWEIVAHVSALTDEEIAVMFINPQSPPASVGRERGETLLEAAGAADPERMKEVVKALLDSLEGRKRAIRRRMEGLGHTW